jgi:DNA-binding transcriptional regulator LsrR (DeoR family)
LVLATSVARRYYLDGRSKIEIADEFQLSRFKVARLLDAARAQGLVRIEISYPGSVDVGLSARLQEAFQLQHAVVVDTHDEDEGALREHLGRAAADLLSEIVTPADVLGLAWARSVSAMATVLQRLPAIPVVQLTGALSRTTESSSSIDTDSSIDVVRVVARVSGGPAYLFFAPFLVPDPATAQALLRQPDVARAFGKIASVTKAVVGIGRWGPAQSTLYEAATEAEREGLQRQGVIVDMAGVFFDAEGHPMPTSLNERMVAVSAAQLEAIPEVIAIPYGLKKQPAVLAALRSGLVNSVVTHASLATALLEHHSSSPLTTERS